MILIDTNIISEMMKSVPSPQIIDWIDSQDSDQLYVAATTIAEIAYGLGVLPDGKRRNSLEREFDQTIKEGFKGRVLSFDETAARMYGIIMSKRKELGLPMSILDGQIAAIANVHHCTLATRNVKDFQECDLELVNPFIPATCDQDKLIL